MRIIKRECNFCDNRITHTYYETKEHIFCPFCFNEYLQEIKQDAEREVDEFDGLDI